MADVAAAIATIQDLVDDNRARIRHELATDVVSHNVVARLENLQAQLRRKRDELEEISDELDIRQKTVAIEASRYPRRVAWIREAIEDSEGELHPTALDALEDELAAKLKDFLGLDPDDDLDEWAPDPTAPADADDTSYLGELREAFDDASNLEAVDTARSLLMADEQELEQSDAQVVASRTQLEVVEHWLGRMAGRANELAQTALGRRRDIETLLARDLDETTDANKNALIRATMHLTTIRALKDRLTEVDAPQKAPAIGSFNLALTEPAFVAHWRQARDTYEEALGSRIEAEVDLLEAHIDYVQEADAAQRAVHNWTEDTDLLAAWRDNLDAL